MIIGCSGYAGNGKDLSGQMMQYLLTTKEDISYSGSFNSFIMDVEMGSTPRWEIKKYATKLKQIASILTGIPVEWFEDQAFKNTFLGDEWARWTTVTKDLRVMPTQVTYGEFFSTEAEAQKDCESIRRMIKRKGIDNVTVEPLLKRITVREFLQRLGTEAMRDVIHPNIWCTALFSEYDAEKWEDIKGYEGSYQISSYGKVRSLDRKIIYGDNIGEYHTRKGQLLKPSLSRGYETVSLNDKTFSVHNLVASAFCEKPNIENLVINHIDFNKINNYWKNLEWITQSENIGHNYKAGNACIGEKQPDAKLNKEKVILIKKLLSEGVVQNTIAKTFEVSPTTISDIKKGRKWSHIGKELPLIKPVLPPNWIITDVRFPNEAQAIKDRGGIILRIDRPAKVDLGPRRTDWMHSSETALDTWEFDYEIDNDGGVEDLMEEIKIFLEVFNIHEP